MAYGTQVYHWRSYGNWSTSISGRNFKVTLTVGMGSVAWGYNLGVIANANIDGTTNSIRSDFYSATGATVDKNMLTISKTFTRGHSNVNKGLSWSIVNGSGYHNGTSKGSGTITVPAVASHTVTFDDNGGSEGPKSTTKWEYESLTIPSKIPTRKNYKFLGWSSSNNSASAEYEAGESYDGTKDENYTLYAVWKILYIPPSFSNALALRTASASSTTNDPDGAYCYASFTWNVDTSVYPNNVLNTIDIKYYQDDSTVGTVVTPSGITSGATGTVNVHFPASLSSVYSIVCVISDTQGGSVSIARSIGSGSIPIEVSNKGHSIGIMSSAPISPGVKIGSSGTPSFEHLAETINGNLNSVARIYGETSSDGQGELILSTQGLDSLGALSGGTINFIADNLKFNSQSFLPKAWVVEESDNKDPNVGWVWKKYGDGTAECWAKITTSNFNVTNDLGNGFYYNYGDNLIDQRNYPFTFSEVPEELVNIDLQGTYSGVVITSWFSWAKKNTVSKSKAYQVFAASILKDVVACINFHIVGKYE